MNKHFLVLPPRVCPGCGAKSEPGQDDPPVYYSFGLGVTSKMECWRTCSSCGCHEKVEMATASEVVEVSLSSRKPCPLPSYNECPFTKKTCHGRPGDDCPMSCGPIMIVRVDQ